MNCGNGRTCQGLGSKAIQGIGCDSWPCGSADYLLLFDFSLWLVGGEDATLLVQPATPADPNIWGLIGYPQVGVLSPPWNPVLGCAPDFAGDATECDFPPAVNPGASGGSGGPPGSVEVKVPWEAFGCTGCPAACSCPGFGPGVPFRFTMDISRGTTSLDFTPDGAHEDVLSEAVNNPIRMLTGWYIVGPDAIAPASLLLSYWMVGCYFMALKRFAELRSIGQGESAAAYRRSFRYYTPERLLVSVTFYASAAMLFFGAFIMR